MNRKKEAYQFGTFQGVFTPSILTILGIILFMRADYVLGKGGIIVAFLILLLSVLITFLTALSLSAIATNTPIRGGGAYFIVSRSLGPEFGGSIGVALYLAQALSVPFYILGFTEALTRTLSPLAPYFELITIITLLVLFILSYIGADWALKTQTLILIILGLSIFSFLIGATLKFQPHLFKENLNLLGKNKDASFWGLFAIYFPAVTGIMAGVNLSGDLKNPGRALPLGTLLAVGVSFLIYGAQIFLLGGAFPGEILADKPFKVLLEVSLFRAGFLVVLGVFAASLSSAIGSFLGAPRVLQALSRDDLIPPLRPFSCGAKKGDEPKKALWFTFFLSLGVLLYAGNGRGGGALNAVAGVITMFFLFTYGMTNMAAFVESFSQNPSFRPRFRYFNWVTGLLGVVLTFLAAFLVHFVAALIAIVIIALLYLYLRRRVLKVAFGDARRGLFYEQVRLNLFRLFRIPQDPKNWRPTILVLTGNPNTRLTLSKYAVWLGSGHGLVTLCHILLGDYMEMIPFRKMAFKRLEEFIKEKNIFAFPEVIVAPTFEDALFMLLQGHSTAPIKPNILLFGWSHDKEQASSLFKRIRYSRNLGKNVIILRDRGVPSPEEQKRIDIWWRGRENGSMMLLLAYLLTRNWEWSGTQIRILRVVKDQGGKEMAREALTNLVEAGRIQADVEVIVSGDPFEEILRKNSSDASTVFLGLVPPEEGKEMEIYETYQRLLEHLPTTLLVSSIGEVDLLA